jgi:pimeloyl-ACP methyl ester carboxylesterase
VGFLWKLVKIAVTAGVAVLALGAGSLFALRAVRGRANAEAFAIRAPEGIDEAGYVRIGGIPQWIQVRGRDHRNPILLCVHGGPGATWTPVSGLFLPWEKDFTVVQWDQRGAGKTLTATGPGVAESMSVDRMAQDGIEVAEYLRAHVHQDKVILLGHSWGSILGIHMVKRRPDLFWAYVGTGQASDLPRSLELDRARVLAQAESAGDAATAQALRDLALPLRDMRQAAGFFGALEKYQPASDGVAMAAVARTLTSPPPGYTLHDALDRLRGFTTVPTWRLYEEMLGTRLAALGPDFKVPMVFIQGAEDPVTPASLADEFCRAVQAPHKELVRLEGGGHFAVWSMADRFGRELVTRVRPLAIPAPAAP